MQSTYDYRIHTGSNSGKLRTYVMLTYVNLEKNLILYFITVH